MQVKFFVKAVIILTLLLQSTFALSQETYRFNRMWPTLSQPWYFADPRAIASDMRGHTYVVDSTNCNVSKFSSDGFLITKWGSFGSNEGEFNQPQGASVDKDGYLYLPNVSEKEEKVQIMNIQRLYNDIVKIIEKINKNCAV